MSHHSIIHAQGVSPELIVEKCLAEFEVSHQETANFVVVYSFSQYWLQDAPVVDVQAFYELSTKDSGIDKEAGTQVDIRFAVSGLNDELQKLYADAESLASFCANHSLSIFDAAAPAQLQTVAIAKPWGQEIWYTGVESRGVASLVGLNGLSAPLPLVISSLPNRLAGAFSRSLILLKILDPLPQEVVGDLYFELHEEKREVYVVTAVDEAAWPNGQGAIRFGFDQQKIAAYGDEQSFKADYIGAVKAYEATRREIDCLVDKGARVSDQLQSQEHDQRKRMNDFTHLMPLQVGDVVKVPLLTPHSLQHGVRTVEFQTPVYERLIVSFAQKVLTQPHWDTDRAANLMTMAPNLGDGIELLEHDEVTVERIVDFDDFEVRRFTLAKGQSVKVSNQGEYCLLMSVVGDINVGSLLLKPEQAAFAPKNWQGAEVVNCSDGRYCFLIAYPK